MPFPSANLFPAANIDPGDGINLTQVTFETLPVWDTSWLQLSDLKSWGNWNGITARDDDMTLALMAAMEWVQDEIGRPIVSTAVQEVLDGSAAGGPSGAHLMLRYAPLISIESVTESYGSGTATLTYGSDFDVNPVTGRLIRTTGGTNWYRPWYPGSRNITVNYHAGYAALPPKVKEATLQYSKWYWLSTQSGQGAPVPGGGSTGSSAPQQPGIPNVVHSLLASYKTPRMA